MKKDTKTSGLKLKSGENILCRIIEENDSYVLTDDTLVIHYDTSDSIPLIVLIKYGIFEKEADYGFTFDRKDIIKVYKDVPNKYAKFHSSYMEHLRGELNQEKQEGTIFDAIPTGTMH